MAGLVVAARARELGASVELRERGDRPGGSMLLSSGVVWRYRDLARFRQECPGGDPELQRLVHERLDDALGWLEGLGAPVVARETGNPLTSGLRFDPPGLTRALVARAGEVALGQPVGAPQPGVPLVLATGGFQGSRALVRRYVTPEAGSLVLRANPWSDGDGLRIGLAAGAELSDGLEQFYGRNLPAPPARVEPAGFVELAQVYARPATVTNAHGERYEARTGSESGGVQWTARQPEARAWYSVPEGALEEAVRERTVGDAIAAAERAGARVARRAGAVELEVVAGITTTLGGLRAAGRGRGADGVWPAGTDVGGISTGGYASGLAAALVLGLAAAEDAAG
jgi:succinate dehydrogenase/fumarate reductase flavoprotein subunit